MEGKPHESTSRQIWIKLSIVFGHELRFNNNRKNKKSLRMRCNTFGSILHIGWMGKVVLPYVRL